MPIFKYFLHLPALWNLCYLLSDAVELLLDWQNVTVVFCNEKAVAVDI
jgi:hypothetical protein